MLTDKESAFVKHWELVRVEYSSTQSKLLRGLPMALLFSFPIFFSVILVYFFSPEWYTKISPSASGATFMIFVSVLLIALFFSFTRMHFKWEMNEQLYNELMYKKNSSKE